MIFHLVDFINKNINLERISNHENISQSGFESFMLYFWWIFLNLFRQKIFWWKNQKFTPSDSVQICLKNSKMYLACLSDFSRDGNCFLNLQKLKLPKFVEHLPLKKFYRGRCLTDKPDSFLDSPDQCVQNQNILFFFEYFFIFWAGRDNFSGFCLKSVLKLIFYSPDLGH